MDLVLTIMAIYRIYIVHSLPGRSNNDIQTCPWLLTQSNLSTGLFRIKSLRKDFNKLRCESIALKDNTAILKEHLRESKIIWLHILKRIFKHNISRLTVSFRGSGSSLQTFVMVALMAASDLLFFKYWSMTLTTNSHSSHPGPCRIKCNQLYLWYKYWQWNIWPGKRQERYNIEIFWYLDKSYYIIFRFSEYFDMLQL